MRVAIARTTGQALRRRWKAVVRRVRQRGRSAAYRAARIAGASVAAFLVAQGLGLVDPPPLVAALTALLVVQATAASTLVNSVQRVLSVVAGVALAVVFVSAVGLSILVAVSIVVGQLLRLGPHLLEVPISAMLVLGVGFTAGAEVAGLGRVVETLVGAAVGVLVNVLFPPAVQTRHAGQAVQRLAEEIAALLEEAAQGLGSPSAGSSVGVGSRGRTGARPWWRAPRRRRRDRRGRSPAGRCGRAARRPGPSRR